MSTLIDAVMHRRLTLAFVAFLAGTLFAGFFLFSQSIRRLSFPSPLPFFSSISSSSNTADSEFGESPGETAATSAYVPDLASNKPTHDTTNSKYLGDRPNSQNEASTTSSKLAHTTASSEHDKSTSQKSLFNVAITETGGAHDEVVAALVHSFGSQKNVQISGMFQLYPRWGMPKIMENFTLSHPPLPKNRGMNAFKQAPTNETSPDTSPDILVISTCELDMLNLRSRLDVLLKEGKTYIFCVIHHADRWHTSELKNAVTPWIKAGMLDFVALSAHTAKYLENEGLNDWSVNITSPIIYVPVFPVSLPPIMAENEKAFALQGNYEASRRDFKTIFSHLQSFIDASRSGDDDDHGNVTLRLLGSGNRPEVPEALSEHVFFDEGLSYKEFYAVLSRTFALLPAFANDEYLSNKASSTVPASLLAGAPLVATKGILAAYSYLPEDAVYLQKDGETELEVIGRVLKANPEKRKAKKALVRKACTKIIDDNVDLVEGWLQKVASKISQ